MGVFAPVRELLLDSWGFFLKFLLAIVIFVIGWLVAKFIKTLVIRLLKALRIDTIAEQVKIADFLSKGGIKHTLAELIGIIIYWIILLGVLASSLNILQLTVVSSLLDKVIGYLPNVIGAVIIVIVGTYLAVFVGSVVRTATANVGLVQASVLSKLSQVAIVVFTIVVALDELKIGAVLVSAMNIVLATIGLGLALAFGLGCKDIAARFTSDIIEKLKKK